MKKKVLLVLLCGSLSMSVLTACGGGQETVTEEVATVEEIVLRPSQPDFQLI